MKFIFTGIFWILFLYGFWKIGDPFPISTKEHSKNFLLNI